MNSREFAAAHDRYLEPEDDRQDDSLPDDEMDLADIARQKRLDHEDWEAETLRQRQECDE